MPDTLALISEPSFIPNFSVLNNPVSAGAATYTRGIRAQIDHLIRLGVDNIAVDLGNLNSKEGIPLCATIRDAVQRILRMQYGADDLDELMIIGALPNPNELPGDLFKVHKKGVEFEGLLFVANEGVRIEPRLLDLGPWDKLNNGCVRLVKPYDLLKPGPQKSDTPDSAYLYTYQRGIGY